MYTPKHALFLALLFVSFHSSGQLFVFDVTDTSSFSYDCGKLTSAYWGVKADSCTLTTQTFPNLGTGCVTPGTPITVPIDLTINQTGNLDCTDTAWIEYMVDSVWYPLDTIIGCEQTSNTTYHYLTTETYAGCDFAVRVTYQTDANQEKWQLRDGDLVIHDPCILLPLQAFTIHGNATFAGNELVVRVESPYSLGSVTIERKTGDTFDPIGEARYVGEDEGVRKYQFLDTRENPVSYYRAVVTSDATVNYTSIIKVVSAKLSELTIHPNPAREWLSVRMPGGLVPGMQFHLVDAAGKIVQSWEQVEKVQDSIQLNVDNLPGGLYMLVMDGGANVTSAMVSIRY